MANYCVKSGGTGTGTVAGTSPTTAEWAAAYASISACLTGATLVAGDTIFVSNNHAGIYGAATTLSPAVSVSIISIDDTTNGGAAVPLVGALENTNGNMALNFSPSAGSSYMYGVTLKAGNGTSSGSTSVNINANLGAVSVALDNCDLWINSTNTAPNINFGAADISGSHLTVLKNCRFRFGNASQRLSINGAQRTEMYGCAINSAGAQQAIAFQDGTHRGASQLLAQSCDFSYATSLINVANDDEPCNFKFVNCVIPSNIYTGTYPGIGAGYYELQGCGTSTDDHNYQYSYLDGSGQINQNTGVYLTTGGASFTDTNGSLVPVSLQEVSSVNASKAFPLKTPWFNVEVPSTGSKTFSVKIANTVAALTDTEVWLELEYMADANNPKTTNVIDAPVVSGTNSLNILAAGTNRTDTAEAWTGITGEVTHTLSKTVTVNQIGWARARVCLAKASTTIYVDPKVRLS